MGGYVGSMQSSQSIAVHPAVRGLGLGLLFALGGALLPGCKADAPSNTEAQKPGAETAVAAAKPVGEPAPAAASGPALTIAYSDWPGWVAWDIGLKKGWFDAAGVKV